MSIPVRETQTSRENEVIRIVTSILPELHLASRRGRGAIEGQSLPRLLYERKPDMARSFWRRLSSAPASPDELLVLTITGRGNQALELERGWIDMSIHVFAPEFLNRAKDLAQRIAETTGKNVEIVREE